MAITFKYGAPGPVLAAGFAAGVGNRQQRQQENSLDLWQQQNQQNFQAKQQEKMFELQLDRDELGRAASSRENALDRQQQLELARRREDEFMLEGLQKKELELPPEAQKQLDKLDAGRVAAMKLDPPQQQEFMRKYEAERRGLLGLARPIKQLGVEDEFKQNTIEKDGALYQREKGGGFSELRKAPEDQTEKLREKSLKEQEAYSDRVLKEATRQAGELGDPSKYMDKARATLEAAGFKAPTPYMDVSGVDAQALAKFGGFDLAGGLTKMTPPTDGNGYSQRIIEPQGGPYAQRTIDPPAAGSRNPPPPSLSSDPSNMPPGPPPPAGAPQGAKQAPDGKWYVADPNRPGKFLQWVP